MIGDFLYSLTPRDQQGIGIEIVHRFVKDPAAVGISRTAAFTVPSGRVMKLTRVWCEFSPHSTDYITNAEIYLNAPDAVEFYPMKLMSVATRVTGVSNLALGYADFSGEGFASIGKSHNLDWDGEIYLEPGATVAARAFFSNANVAHQVLGVFFGLLIPRGNLVF